MKKMFVGNLAPNTTDDAVRDLFSQYGTVRSLKLAMDVFNGTCKGFGFIEMEGHEARAAISNLNGKTFNGRPLRVNEEQLKGKNQRKGYRR